MRGPGAAIRMRDSLFTGISSRPHAFASPGSGFRSRRSIWAPEGIGPAEMCRRAVAEERSGLPPRGAQCPRPSAVGSGFPGLWREARLPPCPFSLALYLDAEAQSWDLTFLRLRRPGDCRQGALRASTGEGREDARSSHSALGEWVGVLVNKPEDSADLGGGGWS